MKTTRITATLALLIAMSAFTNAADTAQEHSDLVKAQMARNALAKCRSAKLKEMTGALFAEHKGCPKDFNVPEFMDKVAAESCTSEYDAAVAIQTSAFSHSMANADEAKKATDAQFATDKQKWAEKASKPLIEACQAH